MASRISRSSIKWPPRKPDRLNFESGTENHILFPYDGDFFGVYGDFLDAVDKVVHKHHLDEKTKEDMFAMCNPALHVDIMIHEENGDTSGTEAHMDDIHNTFEEAVAQDFLEEVVNFHNCGIRPHGFDTLRLIQAQEDGFILTELTPVREEDTVIYTFVNFSE
jgi:transcriptional regulator with PAS, ATPase and Fis domain